MPITFQISRRSFIKRCSLTATTTGLPLWFVERDLARAAEQNTARATSPNDLPGLALICCGGQGSGDLAGAARAKKDVYGEKPLTRTIDKGKRVIRAVRDNKIVFQTVTQQRTDR